MKKMIVLWFMVLVMSVQAQNVSLLKESKDLVADGKNVMLFFGTKTCGYCDIMKKDFVDDQIIYDILKKDFNVYYIPLDDMNDYNMGDKTPPQKTNTVSLKMTFSVKATPQIVIFDENWNKLIQLPGYADPSQMKIFLNYVTKDYYKNKDLSTYLKEMGMM